MYDDIWVRLVLATYSFYGRCIPRVGDLVCEGEIYEAIARNFSGQREDLAYLFVRGGCEVIEWQKREEGKTDTGPSRGT